MRLPVVLSHEAEADLDEAVDWYEARAGLGAEFVVCIREMLQRIGQMPESHAVIRDDVRRAVVRRFPYSVLYRVKADRVEVIAIFQGRRDPTEWQRRI